MVGYPLSSRVDIKPDEDAIKRKKYLVRTLEAKLGPYIFDGTMLFSIRKLAVEDAPAVFTAQNKVSDRGKWLIPLSNKSVS